MKTQKERYITQLIGKAEKQRLSSQDSEIGPIDIELAKAREMRDVSMISSP